jgi:parvulin-like peptidyl-prolyl isomerase
MLLIDKVIMIINGEPVLKSELEFAKIWFKTPDDKKALQQLVDIILISQQAKKFGIRVSPYEIREALQNVAKANNFNSIEEFKKHLIDQGIVYSEFKSFVQRELLRTKFVQLYLKPSIFKGIKEGEIQKIRKVRIIYLDKNKSGYLQKLKQLEKHLNKKNFAELAKKFSDDEFTKKEGGLLGYVKKGDLLKILDDVIWKQKVGEIFELETEKGTYFIYIEKEDQKIIPKTSLNDEQLKKLEKEYKLYVKKLRQNACIEFLDENVKKLYEESND